MFLLNWVWRDWLLRCTINRDGLYNSAQCFACWWQCQKIKILKYFCKNHAGYLNNNRCTDTRLVCTHLNAFFMLNPYMQKKIWILNIFVKTLHKIWNVFCTQHSTLGLRKIGDMWFHVDGFIFVMGSLTFSELTICFYLHNFGIKACKVWFSSIKLCLRWQLQKLCLIILYNLHKFSSSPLTQRKKYCQIEIRRVTARLVSLIISLKETLHSNKKS